MLKMKYNELRKLNKLELLELVYNMRTELDKVEGENRRLKRNLEDREKDYNELLYNTRTVLRQVSKLAGEEYLPFEREDGEVEVL
ncbi:hypothetical protein SAMN02745111_01910 [Eubacterium uniforme]|uniref:Uncharacterized protein n=2 Tax=Eubacteriaceae TaxID=186806 RepID=A0A1T4VXZ0_9FIRM|nr:hypothetical protein SAMN02745111_01910 [Eubacterium uniforme]